MARLKVNQHAIDRFKARTGCGHLTRALALERLKYTFNKTVLAEVKPKFRVQQLLRYGIDQDVEYRIRGNTVFVVVGGVVTTVHCNESKRWRAKK